MSGLLCDEKKVGFVRLSVRLICLEHDFEDLLVQSVCVTLPVFIISLACNDMARRSDEAFPAKNRPPTMDGAS